MPVVSVKKPLREKLGDDGVDALIDLINDAQKETRNNVIEIVEEKFERRLSEELSKINIKISDIETKLIEKISKSHSDVIKWMFIFWVGQIGAILGILFAFFKG